MWIYLHNSNTAPWSKKAQGDRCILSFDEHRESGKKYREANTPITSARFTETHTRTHTEGMGPSRFKKCIQKNRILDLCVCACVLQEGDGQVAMCAGE